MADPSFGGILLTGGASTRFGSDKSLLEIEGEPLAVRLARLLARVTTVAVEVGPGRSGLGAVSEEPAGSGPLPALLTGWEALRATPEGGSLAGALVLSCDLPRLDEQRCRLLLAGPPDRSVVPVLGRHPQLLAARWAGPTLRAARELATRSPRRGLPVGLLLGYGPVLFLHPRALGGPEGCAALTDVDTPADLERLRAPRRPSSRRSALPVAERGPNDDGPDPVPAAGRERRVE